jgi:hypothetical protein
MRLMPLAVLATAFACPSAFAADPAPHEDLEQCVAVLGVAAELYYDDGSDEERVDSTNLLADQMEDALQAATPMDDLDAVQARVETKKTALRATWSNAKDAAAQAAVMSDLAARIEGCKALL